MLKRIVFGACAAMFLACISGAAPVPADDKKADDPAKARAEMMKRWNAVAKGVTASGPIGPVGFDWTDADAFPHPTFKGGSSEAYAAFAQLLVKFLETGDNFDYLAKNKLFSAELRYTTPGGKGTKWTFEQLAASLSDPKAYGDHSDATRKSLKALAEKMKKAAKP